MLDNPWTIESRYSPQLDCCPTCDEPSKSYLPGVSCCSECAAKRLAAILETYVPELKGDDDDLVTYLIKQLEKGELP